MENETKKSDDNIFWWVLSVAAATILILFGVNLVHESRKPTPKNYLVVYTYHNQSGNLLNGNQNFTVADGGLLSTKEARDELMKSLDTDDLVIQNVILDR